MKMVFVSGGNGKEDAQCQGGCGGNGKTPTIIYTDNPYPICENCIFVDEPLEKDPCRECNRAFLAQRIKPNFVSKHKPKTNADRIRTMSDKELARFLTYQTESCLSADGNGWLDWLKQETKE